MPITKKQDGDQGLAKQVEAPLEMPTQEKRKAACSRTRFSAAAFEAATPLNTVPDLSLDEWVGEPAHHQATAMSAPLPAPEETPLTRWNRNKRFPKKRDNAPLALAPTDDAPRLTDQTDKADEPLMLGTPLPDKKKAASPTTF